MSNNLNDIVDIQIRIAAPATGIAGFGSILIVGPGTGRPKSWTITRQSGYILPWKG